MNERRSNEKPDATPESDATIVERIYALARAIPAGRVLSYGALGASCSPPISGYVCGRILNNVADDVPWWRVVAKDGALPIAKRNPALAARQRALLESEDVEFDEEGRVRMREFGADQGFPPQLSGAVK